MNTPIQPASSCVGRRQCSLHVIHALLATVLIAMAGFTSIAADAEKPPAAPTPVLLVCEHGSVKSLIAASLFNQAASERGLPFRAIARGVTPEASVPQKLADALGREAFEVRQFKPAAVSRADIAHASLKRHVDALLDQLESRSH
jgi:hypothetical protein